MLRLIIFAIIILWIVVNIARAKAGKKEIPADDPQPERKNNRSGKKYSWAWMQTAGALGLKFIRPEAANGYPAIEGTINGIEVSVRCLPPVPYNDPFTLFSYRFPQTAKTGLKLLLSADPAEREHFANGKKSGSLQDILGDRNLKNYFLEIKEAELFRQYFPRECVDSLGSMSVIYPRILLTDSELHVLARGIREEPQSFQHELTAQLEVAGKLADFAKKTAAGSPKPAKQPDPKPEVKKEVEPPAPKEQPLPRETEQKPEKDDEPVNILEKTVFIRNLWSADNLARQKEMFEKYRDSEVEWSGVLKSFYPYSSDFTFGPGPGVKAVFELEEFKPEGSFMPVKIKAVAAFSKDAAGHLDHAYGKIFSFRGRLLKLEPIAREIYVSDGILLFDGVES